MTATQAGLLSRQAISGIADVLARARAERRDTLFEHEVYAVLREVGLAVPDHVFLPAGAPPDRQLLQRFHGPVVLKVVSPSIVHKQKVGGVRVVRDRNRIAPAIASMRRDIRAAFAGREQPDIVGFLVVEFVSFSQGIGYETLVGFRQDPAFGPVLTVTKGGDDAEFFARYYDPPNLVLPPLDPDHARAMVQAMNIRHKFEEAGHPEYLESIADAASTLSRLAFSFSPLAGEKPAFLLQELEVNPFVIARDHRFVAVDGFARFTPYVDGRHSLPEVRTVHLDRFFRPEGIAVVGVSGDRAKVGMGREIAHMLHDCGRKDLYLVNPRGGRVLLGDREYPLYRNLKEIPVPVDLAVYAAPAAHTVDFLRDLPPGNPKAVVLISGIPADVRYVDFADRLEAVLPTDTRIIGPNCIGVFHAPDGPSPGVNTFFLDQKRLTVDSTPSSNTALLTQSGALAITMIDKMKVSRIFRAVVSFGNKFDVKITDLVAYFGEDPAIDVVALYVEGLDAGEGRRFFELAKSCRKPVIAYKSGRTEAGARAAASHTASMTGSYDVFRAACDQSGVILADKIEDYADYIKAFSLLAHRKPGGNRVAGVLNAGFESAVGADEMRHLRQAVLSEETVGKLRSLDRNGLVDLSTSFLDVTPSADDGMFADFISAVLADDGVDCVFVANVPHSHALKSDPESCHDEDSLASRLAGIAAGSRKPIVVSVNGGRYYQELTSLFERSGLPVYGDVRSAIKSLDRFVAHHVPEGAT